MTVLLRGLTRALCVLCVLLVIVVLGVRYWLLPQIDQWREPIAQHLSRATNTHIDIGQLQVIWHGVVPELQVRRLQIKDQQLNALLAIPSLTARIKWRDLLARQIAFSYLRVEGLALELWRDKDKRLHLAGQVFAEFDSESNFDSNDDFMFWLAKQDRIELQDAQLTWHDQSRDAQPLHVTAMHGSLQFIANTLNFNLQATPQAGMGQSAQLIGQLVRPDAEINAFDGTLYVQINGLSPAGWRQWVDLPTDLSQATLDTQIWLDLKQSQFDHISMDTRIYNGVWHTPELGQFTARSLRVFAASNWQAFNDFAQALPLGQRLQSGPFKLEMVAQGVAWQSAHFAMPLQIDDFIFAAQRNTDRDEGVVNIKQLSLKNADFHANIEGSWTPKGTDVLSGKLDLLGRLNQVQIKHLYRYFPMPEISAEVVDWLQRGLVQGVVPSAVLRWQGNMHDFPYDDNQTGLFYVGGPFIDAEIDYYLPDANEKGWPKVEQAAGHLALRGMGLWVNADSAVLKPNGKEPVHAKQVRVHINDFDADEPILSIQGQTTGAAQAYLGLMTHSDLGALLDHAFDHSTATGQWQVPLDLRINLENEDDVQVSGRVEFMNNTVQLLSFLPPLEQVRGHLYFNETGARAENIKAQWLGGPVVVKDQIGQAGELLKIQGQASMKALAQYAELPQMLTLLQGGFAYQAQLGFDQKDAFYVTAQSNLLGLSATLPAPLTKATATAMPFQLTWQAINTKQHGLRIQLDKKLQMLLIENKAASPMFSQGSISWQQPLPQLPPKGAGYIIDIQQDQLDMDAWQQVYDQWSLAATTTPSTLSLLDLVRLRLKSKQAVLFANVLDEFTYTMQQTPAPSAHQGWRADISAKQVAGTVRWQLDQKGQVLDGVDAKLQRLHWHANTASEASEASDVSEVDDFDLDLPDLRLQIDDLRWQDWRLGALQLKGENASGKSNQWRIPVASLKTPHGSLQATGFWQLKGAERGLSLSLQAQSEHAGQLLSYVGLKEALVDGTGTVAAELQWHHFPWATKIANVDATVDVDLNDGRFDQLNSRAAKMLEFLSLQSLSRLSRLDLDVRGLMKEGFPFDDMTGRLTLRHNILSTNNFKVVGPAGTIAVEGQTDLTTEQLDLKAVVVPNVDMTGAAIAAGIALNPVIGLGAFVTQLLLKDPLAKAMTVQYELIGPWDQFKTEEIKLETKAIGPENKNK